MSSYLTKKKRITRVTCDPFLFLTRRATRPSFNYFIVINVLTCQALVRLPGPAAALILLMPKL
jgi:hypothetical protein